MRHRTTIRAAMVVGVCVIAGTAAVRAEARRYYVDPQQGREEAAGTRGDPLPSPAALVGRLQSGDTVILGGGRYEESVRFTDSGTAQDPIVIRNAKGQMPVVAGATWRLSSVRPRVAWASFLARANRTLTETPRAAPPAPASRGYRLRLPLPVTPARDRAAPGSAPLAAAS